jgi:midasin
MTSSVSPPTLTLPLTTTIVNDPFSPESMAAAAALFTSPHTTATFDGNALYDPLKINLEKQVRTLLGHLFSRSDAIEGQLGGAVDVLTAFVSENAAGKIVGKVLDAVSRCLSIPQLVEHTARLFRPLLVDLFARWLGQEGQGEEVREERLIALAYIVEVFEEVYP